MRPPELWPLVGATQMRALDQHTIDVQTVPGALLMESAGRAVVEAVLAELEETGGGEVVVVCGAGNNGGDGFVVARHLWHLGVPARTVLQGAAARISGDAAANLARLEALGGEIEGEAWAPPDRGVIVDALFGTGLARVIEGSPAATIERINAARAGAVRVVAVDLPSGVDADSGQVWGVAVQADATVTMGLPKVGLTQEPGRSLAGRIAVARIGIADHLPGETPQIVLWGDAVAGALLPTRPGAGHKGTFGHVLLVAGSEGKTGAAVLAAAGAGRAGAGLVTIACPAGLNDILEAKCTEAMTVPVADTPERALAASAEDAIVALAAERDLVAAGPGIGRLEETRALMAALAKRLDCPLVLDADGIVAFEGHLSTLKGRGAPTILTPHPGEAARLLECTPGDINADRVEAARTLAARSGAVVLLKGAGTVAAAADGRVVVNPTGGPLLATGGTGDVLLGIVAAYVAQGLPALEAAAAAAYVHGAAADRLAERLGGSGLLAGELADEVAEASEALRRRAGAARGDQGGAAAQASRTAGGSGSRLALPFPGP